MHVGVTQYNGFLQNLHENRVVAALASLASYPSVIDHENRNS